MEYHVLWTIELDAESFEDAARRALEIHRDPNSIATHFEVSDASGNVQEVDLGYPVDSGQLSRVYVLVSLEEGIISDVEVYGAKKSAQDIEQQWLRSAGIRDEKEQWERSNYGTGIAIWECEVKP